VPETCQSVLWERIISRGTVFLDFCIGLGVSERDFGPSLFEGGVGLEFETPQWRGSCRYR